MILTILTPAYNREGPLRRLYASLCRQTCPEFIWMVVDDGSGDGTWQTLEELRAENRIRMEIYRKENGGKHTALNLGISRVSTLLILIVDSDDWMKDDGVEQVLRVHQAYRDRPGLCGYSFLKENSDGTLNGVVFPEEEFVGNHIEVRINSRDWMGDKIEAWKTEILREHPFPCFQGPGGAEKFLSEDVVWLPIALRYDTVYVRRAVCAGDYLPDGLTRKRRALNIACPQGSRFRALTILKAGACRRIDRAYLGRALLQYHVYGFFAKVPLSRQAAEVPCKVWYALSAPAGFLLYRRWRRIYGTEKRNKGIEK